MSPPPPPPETDCTNAVVAIRVESSLSDCVVVVGFPARLTLDAILPPVTALLVIFADVTALFARSVVPTAPEAILFDVTALLAKRPDL